MSTTPSERFDNGMDSPVFDLPLNEEASASKGSAKRARAAGRNILERSDLEEAQTWESYEYRDLKPHKDTPLYPKNDLA